MSVQRMLGVVLLQLLLGVAQAECTRDILVPFSDVGVDLRLVDGKRGGISVDYLDEVSRRTGCRFVYIDVPRARAWWMLAHAQADVVPGAIQADWRDESGVFYDQFVMEGVSLLSLRSAPLKLDSSKSILASGLRFAFVRGHDYGPLTAGLVHVLEARGQLALVKDPGTMLRMLQAGRVDGAIVMASIVTTEAEQLGLNEGLSGQGINDLEWGTTGIYLSKISLPAADRELLERTFRELNEEGFYVRGYQQLQAGMPVWVGAGFRYGREPR
ncbi:polar amino acid transport system substrate-binding protein [Pseudomonas fluvialis]|uniref:Polar amino acid transport system substrate-binding protein n=1 Tax=Pseudomonas fluvialis TaxID=1793966 RepID=A0A7X0BW58_9PSED|nr:transporter substrate-binding domain-containing protein [Pseudomonas fluvialis]MBB6342194.1 polar amino acid transport system substrate-binding protein [Pseudomonas fluvialis]